MFIQPWFYQFFCMELQNHGPYPETNCLVHPMAAKALKGWAAVEGAKDHLLVLHFVHATIIVAYTPTELAETPIKDAFYAALDSTLEALPSHRLTLVLGDLNARVGTARDSRDRPARRNWGFWLPPPHPPTPTPPPPRPRALPAAARCEGGARGRQQQQLWYQPLPTQWPTWEACHGQ